MTAAFLLLRKFYLTGYTGVSAEPVSAAREDLRFYPLRRVPAAGSKAAPIYGSFHCCCATRAEKNTKKCVNFLKKGIDFIENLRYNWTVHEQKIKQEV